MSIPDDDSIDPQYLVDRYMQRVECESGRPLHIPYALAFLAAMNSEVDHYLTRILKNAFGLDGRLKDAHRDYPMQCDIRQTMMTNQHTVRVSAHMEISMSAMAAFGGLSEKEVSEVLARRMAAYIAEMYRSKMITMSSPPTFDVKFKP